MYELNQLLDRYINKFESVHIYEPWSNINESGKDPLERSWYTWLKAYKCYSTNKINEADKWLQATLDSLELAPNRYCAAEIYNIGSSIYLRAGEYDTALYYAIKAWELWYAEASKPDPKSVILNVRPLFKLLYEADEIPEEIDSQIYYIWLTDRFTLQFLHSAQTLIHLSGQLHAIELGEKTIAEVKCWYDQYLTKTGIDTRIISLPYARLLDNAGNFYDMLHDNEKAFENFSKAINLLDQSIEHEEFRQLKAQVQFNAGNALSRLSRYKEADVFFNSNVAKNSLPS